MGDFTAGDPNSPANLLHSLCRKILRRDDVADQFNHALRIIGSRFEPSVSADEFQLTEKIKRKLASQNRLSDAAYFSELHNRLSAKSVLKNQWAVLYLLHSISQASNNPNTISLQGSVLDSFFGGTISSRATSTPAPPQNSLQPGMTPGPTPGGISTIYSGSSSGVSSLSSRFTNDPTPTPSSFVPNVRPNTAVRFNEETTPGYADGSRLANLVANSLAVRSRQDYRAASATPAPNSLLEQYKSYKSAGQENTSFEVSEAVLLRDIIFVFQGIDGNVIKLDPTTDAYCIKSEAGVPQSVRDLVSKLAELGWLYRRVRKYLDARTGDKALGLVGQSFCAALQDELTEYYRLVAVLEAQQQLTDQGISPEGASGSLTLRRLAVWTYDPMLRLKILAALVDVCKGKKGGALLSAIHSFMQHGDPFVKSLVNHMLNQVARPIRIIMDKWIYEGELEDSFHEFFVAADYTVKDERLWYEKYSLRKSMIPSFISQELATKILNIGKSINFIHQVCQDHFNPSQALMRTRFQNNRENEQTSDNDFGAAALQPTVDAAYKETSKYLLETLVKKYKFIEHLNAMRRYLLLGQGDFIRHLMDLLESDLAKSASALYMHNLTGVLETAIRATNAQFEDPEILRRLDCRLFEVSPGDTGWDVFSLDYHVDGPISTVFTPESMINYLRIFNFLWRAKRMEYILTGVWKIQTTNYRLLKGIPELAPVLHQSHMLASEMIHFIHQMQYYIMFEVLECCWAELLKKVQEASDLDQVIVAHETFLKKVLSSSLLDSDSRAMLSQLRTIYDLIIKYQSAQENLFKAANGEMEYRRRAQTKITKRTDEGQWGVTEEEEEEQRKRSENFIQTVIPNIKAQLRALSQSYQDMVQEFLVMLTSQSDINLRFLSFRLDFNENYKRKEPKLRRSLTARYSKYIRKAKESAAASKTTNGSAAATPTVTAT